MIAHLNRCRPSFLACCVGAIALGAPAHAQSLFQRPINPQPQPQPPAPAAPANGQPASTNGQGSAPAAGAQSPAPGTTPVATATPQVPVITIDQLSLFSVMPPPPKQYQKHDKIEIIINETSIQKAQQNLKAKKSFELKAELARFPSLKKLIQEATIGDGIGSVGPGVDVSGNSNFKGEGTAERKDRFTARVSALVVEVKPNGLLLIEARETQSFDTDSKTLVVSGVCDPKDLTIQGTVQSSQLANLVIKVEHTGDLRDGATKGWIPQIFETVFGM